MREEDAMTPPFYESEQVVGPDVSQSRLELSAHPLWWPAVR